MSLEQGTILGLSAIASLVVIQVVAMLKGINGRLMAITVAAIAGIAGVSLDKILASLGILGN